MWDRRGTVLVTPCMLRVGYTWCLRRYACWVRVFMYRPVSHGTDVACRMVRCSVDGDIKQIKPATTFQSGGWP